MNGTAEITAGILALLGFVGWLGGGRKWAFRTLLSAIILAVLVLGGIFLYGYSTEKIAEHREQKIHECAVAKVADPKCEQFPQPHSAPKGGLEILGECPLYLISDNASPQEEENALRLAEQECRGEMNPKEQSLHEQIVQYRHEHGIKETSASTEQPKGGDPAPKNWTT
jgi:hypothetical protein